MVVPVDLEGVIAEAQRSCGGAKTPRHAVTPPPRHWRSYGTDQLPSASEALDERSQSSHRGSCGSPATAAARSAWSIRFTQLWPSGRCATSGAPATRLWRSRRQSRTSHRNRRFEQPAGAADRAAERAVMSAYTDWTASIGLQHVTGVVYAAAPRPRRDESEVPALQRHFSLVVLRERSNGSR